MGLGRPNKKESRPDGGTDPLFEGLKRAVPGVVPTAQAIRFPSSDDIAANPELAFDLKNTEGKVFLGVVGATMKPIEKSSQRAAHGGRLIGYADDRHVCTVAGSRSGKGRALLINNLLTYPGSTMVIDPKGDLAIETARHRAEKLGQRVIVLDPFRAAGDSVAEHLGSFNPLRGLDQLENDEMVMAASLIADALIVTKNEKDPHWAETGRQFLEAVILHVCTDPEFEGERTLATVYEAVGLLVEDPAFEERMCNSDAAGGSVAIGAVAYFSKSDRERAGVISTVRRHLHFLSYEKMQRSLADSSFELEQLHDPDRPTTLFLSLPVMHMGSSAGWLRLFVNLLLNAFEASERRSEFQRQEGGHRLLMILDECAALGRLERLEVAIGQVAGLGVKLWTVWQDLGQLKAIFGPRWESFLGNSSVLNVFANTDLFTLEYIERRLGSTLVRSPTQQVQTRASVTNQGNLGQSFSYQPHPVMTTTEIATVFAREDPQVRQLVFLPRIGPVLLHKAYYDQEERFVALRK